MTETKTLLTPYRDTDTVADKLLKNGCTIYCICYGFQNSCDLIVYAEKEKSIKYLYISRFVNHRLKEKIVQDKLEAEKYINRYIGNINDYWLAQEGKNYADYCIEIETIYGIDLIKISVVYEV